MPVIEPHTWATLAGAAFAASSPAPDGPGLYAQQFTPGRGTAVWAIDQGDPSLMRAGMTRKRPAPEGDPALDRAGLNPRRTQVAILKTRPIVDYAFGRHALPLKKNSKEDPGAMLMVVSERRIISPRACVRYDVNGYDKDCGGLGRMRRLSAGIGYGTQDQVFALSYFNDRVLRYGDDAFFINGAILSVTKTYPWLF